MKLFFTAVAVFCSCAMAEGVNVMFAGLADNSYPVFGKRYEKYVQEGLAGSSDVKPVDYAETARLIEKVDFFDITGINDAVADNISGYVPDTTLLVWGRIETYSVNVKRRYIIGSKVSGNAVLVLNLYNLDSRQYLFSGRVKAEYEIPKNPAWFRRADLVTHISSEDRNRIADELSRKAAGQTMSHIAALVRSFKAAGQPDSRKDALKPDTTEKTDVLNDEADSTEDDNADDSVTDEPESNAAEPLSKEPEKALE